VTAGIYIHIPFCVRKCVYCDFLSFETTNFEEYVNALLRELKSAHFSAVDTVFIGGGTPTALSSLFLCEILKAVQEFPLLPDAEITVEVNPGTVDSEKLSALKSHGVNRLSFGLQSTHDHLLRGLGRIHSFAQFKENFHAAQKAGFDNINIDLMFALPKQTLRDWKKTLADVIALAPQHISAYSLTPAENTPLTDSVSRGKIILPDDETDRIMYHEARRLLSDAGYSHYEISNFAKPKFESKHNINCWTMKPYLGFGLGAHSFDGKTRWNNTENMNEYLNGNGKKNIFPLSEKEIISEKIILGLRLMNGVIEKQFAEIYQDEIAQLINDGLLQRQQNRIRLTPHGMDFANRVFSRFLF